MVRLLAHALVLVVGLMLTAGARAEPFDAGPWDRLLSAHVVPVESGVATTVDYDGMARDRAALRAVLDTMSAVTPARFEGWARDQRLAFLIDAYNAFTVDLILTRWPDLASIKDLGSLFRSPWAKRFVPLLGEVRTLDDIEHGMIRGNPDLNDPRIHFAVNCASIGCPALQPRAWQAVDLEASLEAATRAFLADRSRNRLNGGVLELSPLFDWYAGDFATPWRGTRTLRGFLSAYADALDLPVNARTALAEGRLRIDFTDYDWRLNRTPPDPAP